MAEIKLRLIVDGQEKLVTLSTDLDDVGGKVDNINKKFGGVREETGKVASVSKRDLGIFASQIFDSVGATGRLQSQLSNMAAGLATGGIAGAAFAGFAAIIRTITEVMNEQTEKIKQQKEEVEKLRKEYATLSTTELESLRRKNEIERSIAQLEIDLINKRKTTRTSGQFGTSTITYFASSEDEENFKKFNDQLDLANNTLKALGNSSAEAKQKVEDIFTGKFSLKSINDINTAISLLNIEMAGADTQTYRDKLNAKIAQLNDLMGKYKGEALGAKLETEAWNAVLVDINKELDKMMSNIGEILPDVNVMTHEIAGGLRLQKMSLTPDERIKLGGFDETELWKKNHQVAVDIFHSISSSFGDIWKAMLRDGKVDWSNFMGDIASIFLSKMTELGTNALFDEIIKSLSSKDSGGSGSSGGGFNLADLFNPLSWLSLISLNEGVGITPIRQNPLGPLLSAGINNLHPERAVTQQVNVNVRGSFRKSRKDYIIEFTQDVNEVKKNFNGGKFGRN